MNDDAGDVDDGDAEQHAADARASLDAHRYVTAHTHTHTHTHERVTEICRSGK